VDLAAGQPDAERLLFGLDRGDNPLTLLQFSWDTIRDFGLAFNLSVLGAQLLSPFAILRRRWLLSFTLLFDVFRIVAYMTLGALFHFWIAVTSSSTARSGGRRRGTSPP
jgi:hypothetical protein